MKYLLCCFLLIKSMTAFSQVDTTSNLSDTEKLYGLSLFWKEAAYNFAYFDKANINWDSAYQAFIPKILATKNTYEYYRQLKRFAALLKDGHTDVQSPWSLFKGSTNTQVHFDYLEGKVIVKNVIQKDSSLVPFASEVICINNIPIQSYLKSEILPYISSSTTHWLYNRAMNMIYNTSDTIKSIVLKLVTPKGDTVSYETRLTTKDKRTAYDSRFPKFIVYKEFPDDIIYINLLTFADSSVISSFKKHLPKLYNAKGVILDLRVNGGGNSNIGIEILKYFTDQKTIKTAASRTPNHIASFKAWGKYFALKDTLNNPEDKDFLIKSHLVSNSNYWYDLKTDAIANDISAKKLKCPLIILTGTQTASAAEDFLIALANIKGRATTVGEKTEGSTGQPLPFDLPGGGKARICTLRETYPDGKEFVGVGIIPDVEIKRTIEDLVTGKDAALEKAIELLKIKKLNQQ